MQERQTYLWRIFATGASFTLFGMGGLILGVLVFPAMLLLPGGPARRRARMRGLVQHAFRLFVRFINGIGVISYEFHGSERLGRPGQLIIANHPTLVDVVLIVAFTPAPCCVVKAAMFRNPFTRAVARAAGYVSNSPTDEMIHAAAAALRSGDSLVMFPEGTRTRPGQPLQFARGTASIAVNAAVVLTPVYVHCEPLLLPKFVPWYRVPPRRPHYTLEVGEDIDLAAYRGLQPPRASRLLNDWLLQHFTERLGTPGGYNATLGN
ncbi:MAG: 1-acyl-sn-glycerol-3-phosphate acyltransferase [Steroidobacteraceae bacterium]|nr:1-acyl-sn-glycerol-3-phosphate acyltransferase [Steroidobacteraceae bacterium]